MSGIATRLRTFAALGPANAARVFAYRLGLRFGVHPVQHIRAAAPVGGGFFANDQESVRDRAAPARWQGDALLFGAHRVPIDDGPPAWTRDPLDDTGASDPDPEPGTLAPWWRIGDFSGGDIKRIWEFSRFDWVMAFAQQARTGDTAAAARLERWIDDWERANPAFRGPNWKCAQEASIRVLHLSVAALVLGEETRASAAMRRMIDAHVRRIVPTLSYARAQDNNHATSEAGALFVAGAWYRLAGVPGADALLCRGRALLERTVARLFAPDGSFSQYSLNYHRVALDTLSLVEVWRRRAGLEPFSPTWRARAAAAVEWLRVMVDPASGDAPNLGANDGANLLPLTDADYRDHRPSVQLAAALFGVMRAYPPGPWDDAPGWLGVYVPDAVCPLPERAVFDDGGYAVLRHGVAMAMLRYPRFRFRPSQADALHVDLWHDGANLLRDGGSYSYNTDAEWIEYFGGVRSHNTIEFDSAPQMPRLSRFLLGDWLATERCEEMPDGFAAAYRHRAGWRHHRAVALHDGLCVTDTVAGFTHEARLRWRLAPGNWRIEGDTVTDGHHRLTIRADVPVAIELVQGWESRRYFEKTSLPVVEASIRTAGRIVSQYRWTT